MEWIYTFMLAVMVVLAVTGLFTGVTNDAANFLNPAIASKAASLKTIMVIASAGIIAGAVSSSGMMEVARSGMFAPELFTFRDVMVLYLSVMLANIVLLDIYNTMGLPTSTTVALVFCLLGSALAVSLHNSGNTLSDCIKSDSALVIIAGIPLSVVLALACGCVVMYISRLLFSFRYKPAFRRFGALWCGISFTAILYFALFEGFKDILRDNPVIQFIGDNLLLSLAVIWAAGSLLLYFAQMFKVNILKINILAGTFALAAAFAGNDLVNFVGVPVAGYDSYNIAKEFCGGETIPMSGLTNDAAANTKLLLAAGIIMVITLWTSKRALPVSKRELSLSSQHEEEGEQYGSTSVSRGLVRMATAINSSCERIMPQRIKTFIAKRFQPLSREESECGAYDLIRAAVNLTTAAILISIATSLKLPLSTTYVCFMVAMGSSLADRACERESAAYCISGVLTVVSGWFITGFGAMLIAFVVALALSYGGNAAIVIVSLMCGYMLLRSNLKKNRRAAQSKQSKPEVNSANEAIGMDIAEMIETMHKIAKIYDRTMIATFKENRKALKEAVQQSDEIYERSKERKYEIMSTIARMKGHEINAAQYYVQVSDYLNEISKSLIRITRHCFDNIDSNHEGLSKEQVDDLMKINDEVEHIFSHINIMLQRNDFSNLDLIMELRDQLFESISESTANQLLRIKHKEASTKASMLCLTILNETKTLVLHSRNLVKSQRYFLEHKIDKL